MTYGTEQETCSGAVVAPNIVLTAGHCAINQDTLTLWPAAAFRVTTGTDNWVATPGRCPPFPGLCSTRLGGG